MLKVHVYRRIEKRNLTRFISLRTAVRIRLLQLNPLRVKLFVYRRSMSQVDLRYSKRSEIQPRHYLTVIGGTECSSVVEQWHCKLCAAGSIPTFPIPMNCNHWNIFLLLRSVPVFLVGRFMPFKSAHWTFFKFKSRRMNVERKNRNIIYSRKP